MWGWRPHAADRVPGSVGETRIHSAKRCFLNCLKTSFKPCLYLPSCTASFQIACCVLRWLSSGTARVQDGATGLKHHGSEGRIGPAAGSPECQTLLSERLGTSCKPCLYLPSCTASFQIACCVLRWLSSGTARVQDGATGLKHHGSDGRIGPAAGSPECQTLLSKRLRN